MLHLCSTYRWDYVHACHLLQIEETINCQKELKTQFSRPLSLLFQLFHIRFHLQSNFVRVSIVSRLLTNVSLIAWLVVCYVSYFQVSSDRSIQLKSLDFLFATDRTSVFGWPAWPLWTKCKQRALLVLVGKFPGSAASPDWYDPVVRRLTSYWN